MSRKASPPIAALRVVLARASVAFASSAAIVGDWSETAQELIYETNRDVKWICDALQRMEAQEAWRSEKAGEERRVSALGAGAGGVVAVNCEGTPACG